MEQFKAMKNVMILFLLAANIISGQETTRKFRFGLKATPVLSWVKPDYGNTPDNYSIEGGGAKLGFVWGPSAEFFLNETFLVSTGVDFNYSSFKLKSQFKGVPREQSFRNKFIDVPLMLKFRTKEIGYIRYFGLFGLSGGLNNSSKTEFYVGETGSRDQSKKYVQSFRGAILVGGGVEYNFSGNTSIVTSLVFNNGMTNILKDQKVDPEDAVKDIQEYGVNNYFMLNIGLLF